MYTHFPISFGLEAIVINLQKIIKNKSSIEKKLIAYTGIAATLIGIISIIPIGISAWKTKKATSFPNRALILAIISNFLWLVFGLYTHVTASLLMGVLYLAFYLFILYIKIMY